MLNRKGSDAYETHDGLMVAMVEDEEVTHPTAVGDVLHFFRPPVLGPVVAHLDTP